MIILYGVTTEGTSIPIEVTDKGKLVVDTSGVEGFVKQGDDVDFGTVNATGKITGVDITLTGQLESNGLTALPSGEGVIASRSSGGVRPVWRAGDSTFDKDDGTTYTSQITSSGNANFKGKVFSSSTQETDPDNTLVTKDFIKSSGGGLTAYGLTVTSTGYIAFGGDDFSSSKVNDNTFKLAIENPALIGNYVIASIIPFTAEVNTLVQLSGKTANNFTITTYKDNLFPAGIGFEIVVYPLSGSSRRTIRDRIPKKEPRA